MSAFVVMLIICWVPAGAQLKEAWRIEQIVKLDHCLLMNQTAAQGGKFGVISVRCSPVASRSQTPERG